MNEQWEKQAEFIKEMDKMKGILRTNVMLDGTRNEDDAQHSWHVALMALVLADYAQQGVDIDRAVRMLLVHDLVEIDAGDTYAYDAAAYKDKAARETRAAKRIFGMLPGKQGEALHALWEEFEACDTPTAQYASALDRLQPLLGNIWAGGSVWEKHRIDADKVYKRNEIAKQALPDLWDMIQALIEESKRRGYLL